MKALARPSSSAVWRLRAMLNFNPVALELSRRVWKRINNVGLSIEPLGCSPRKSVVSKVFMLNATGSLR